jgi:hypothetical protein
MYCRMGMGMGMMRHTSPIMASGDFTDITTNNVLDGVYTLNGAPVAITDIIDLSNPNTIFDPVDDVDAGGLKINGGGYSGIYLTNALATTMLSAGFTMLVEFYWAPDTTMSVMVHDNDQNAFSYIEIYDDDFVRLNSLPDNSDVTGEMPTEGAVNKLAVTFTDTAITYSLNGLPVHSLSGDILRPAWTMVGITISRLAAEDSARIRVFDIYAPIDDADLPTLSAL